MKPNPEFLAQPPEFWANVKLISQKLGYTEKSTKQIKIPKIDDIAASYNQQGLATTALLKDVTVTKLGAMLIDYFVFRADFLNNRVRPLLMDVVRAKNYLMSCTLAISLRMRFR